MAKWYTASVCVSICIGLGLTGCTDNEPDVLPGESSQLQIGVNQIRTRALDDAFEVKDTIGLYAVKWQDETTPGVLQSWGNYADNIAFALQDKADNWLPWEPVYYPADGSKMDLFAYYPYNWEWVNYDITQIYFRVRPDQRLYADYTASDFITADKKGVSRTAGKVHLTFDHKLSQLVFALKAGEGFTVEELSTATVTIKNAILDVTYDLSEGNEGIPVAGNERSDVLPTGEWKVSEGDASLIYGYKGIIVPQELNEETYFEIALGSRVFVQKFTTPVTMQSGESRLFTITMKNTGLEISTTLNPWNYQGEVEGEAVEREDPSPTDFVVEWEVEAGENKLMGFYTIVLPLLDFTIDWGDGSEPTHIEGNMFYEIKHTYAERGTYEVRISGYCEGFNMTKIKRVKQWGDLGINYWYQTFYGCATLESIPGNMPVPKEGSFGYTFYACTGLKEIPADLFINCQDVKYFTYTFGKCTGLTQIPEELFAACLSVESFEGVFSGCENLLFIPESLFKNCSAVTSYDSAFNDCKSLVSLPEKLFENGEKVTSFNSTFTGCSSLTEIPSGLFENCVSVNSFYGTFSGLESLTKLPDNLFTTCSQVENFSITFAGCQKLQSIPNNLFASCTQVKSFSNTFAGCQNLQSIPEELFVNCTQVENFSQTFTGCQKLQSIPENLFLNCSQVNSFAGTFVGCQSLQSIPSSLFSNCLKVLDFSATFAACSSLQGRTPTTNEVEIWERSLPENTGFPNEIYVIECFSGCTGLENYDQIPDEAK